LLCLYKKVLLPYEKEIPELKMQDAGGAELPYLYYAGGARQILFAHAAEIAGIVKEFIAQLP